MHVSVTFKNLDSSDSLRNYANEKLNRFDKYLDNPAEANVVLKVEKHRHIAEININGDRLSIVGSEETSDMYSAIDMVMDKLEKQIKKSKDRNRKRRGSSKNREKHREAEAHATLAGYDDADETQLLVETIEYKPMDVDEAVLQMGLTDDTFLVFTNAKTGRVNVLYRIKGKRLGLIEPSA